MILHGGEGTPTYIQRDLLLSVSLRSGPSQVLSLVLTDLYGGRGTGPVVPSPWSTLVPLLVTYGRWTSGTSRSSTTSGGSLCTEWTASYSRLWTRSQSTLLEERDTDRDMTTTTPMSPLVLSVSGWKYPECYVSPISIQ